MKSRKILAVFTSMLMVFAFSFSIFATQNDDLLNHGLGTTNAGSAIHIQSFEELKKYFDYKLVKRTENDSNPVERFVLKAGNYEIDQSFEIDLHDAYFTGKEEAIKYGLISTVDAFSIKGNGNTISFKQNDAVALFGMINSPEYEIDGLKISYPKNVNGFAFAQMLKSKDKNKGIASADGMVKNVEVNVGGSVIPLKVIGNEKNSNNILGEYRGYISSGFAWYIQNTNIENITINITGDIGNLERPEIESDMVAAYGFAHHFGNVPYTSTYNADTWTEIHDNGNPGVLKSAGHVIGLNLNVGGNIQGYGNNAGYVAGVGYDMGTAWMENINLRIGGDIVTDLNGNNASMIESYDRPFAFGFSDEVMNLTDSSLEVNNIIFKAENLPSESDIIYLGAVANNNSKGNYINIKNNIIRVKGKIEGKSNRNIVASIGFTNDFNSQGKNGINWIHEREHNAYNIGEIHIESEKIVVFDALGKKWRTGKAPLGKYVLPEASLQNETVEAGDVTVIAGQMANVSLLMSNASNAKHNVLTYGNINVKANLVNFYGMGNLQNNAPEENFYQNITENNTVTMKNLDIEATDSQYISLITGYQDTEQELKNNTAKADNVKIKLNSNQNTYISGIAGYSTSPIDSCRVFLGSINVENSGSKNIYFGIGAARVNTSSIKKSGVFVDGDINVQSKNLYWGGFVGFAKNSTLDANDFQVDGATNIDMIQGSYGGFAGWITNGETKNNSSLILNDFMPFIGYADGASIKNSSHYINKKAPKFFSGLLALGRNNPTIINSTLLLEKDFADTILYRKDIISANSNNNYVVVVDNDDVFNRVAYAVAENVSTNDEMGKEIPVYRKTGEPVGKINIKARTFQEKYWNTDVQPYEIEDAEKSFIYMDGNDAGNISAFGVDSENIVTDGAKNAKLLDYYHRHTGLISDNGIVYDLLGIKGNVRLHVLYDGNGSDSGKVPVDKNNYIAGNNVTVLPNGDLARQGYKFIAWNTEANGSGNNYKAGDRFVIMEDTTLYAIWKKPEIPSEPEIIETEIDIKPSENPSKTEPNAGKKIPQTGDASRVFMYRIILGLIVLLSVGAGYIGKRYENKM